MVNYAKKWSSFIINDLGYCYTGLSGKTATDFDNGTASYITFLNVLKNTIIKLDDLGKVKISPNESQNKVRKGDLLFNTSSETAEEVGMCATLLNDVDELYLNSFCFGFRLYSTEIVDSLFAAYLFNSDFGRKLMVKCAQGSTRYNLSKKNFLSLYVDFPEIKEQKEIASILTIFDEHIDNITELIEKKKAIRDGALEDLVSGVTRLEGFDGEWVNCKFKDICNINQGLQIAISERYSYPGKDRYFYITNEFLKADSNDKYYIENPPKSTICCKDDILMTRTGNTGMVVTNVNGVFHNNFFKINFDKNIIKKDFLYYLLVSKKYNTKILKVAGSSTIPDLNHNDFYGIDISFPQDKNEQKLISDIIADMDKEIEDLENEKLKLMGIREGAMDDLLTGQVRLEI